MEGRNDNVYSVRVSDAVLRDRIEAYRAGHAPPLSRNAAMVSLVTLGLDAAQPSNAEHVRCLPDEPAHNHKDSFPEKKPRSGQMTRAGKQTDPSSNQPVQASSVSEPLDGPDPDCHDPVLDDDTARARVLPAPPKPIKPFIKRGAWRKTKAAKAARRAENVAKRAALKAADPPAIEVDGEKIPVIPTNGHGKSDELMPIERDWLLKRFPDGYVDEEAANKLNIAVSVADRCGIQRGAPEYFDFLDSVLDGTT